MSRLTAVDAAPQLVPADILLTEAPQGNVLTTVDINYHGVINGKVYFGQPSGHSARACNEYYCNLDGSGVTLIHSESNGAYYGSRYCPSTKKIYVAGETWVSLNVWKAAVIIIDVDPESANYNTATRVDIPNTGGCNQLFMVYDDAENSRLLFGERRIQVGEGGTTTTGSTGVNYTERGGLWSVAYADAANGAAYTRIMYMNSLFPAYNWDWRNLVKYNGVWYAYGTGAFVYVLQSSDLLTWTEIPNTPVASGWPMIPLVSTYHNKLFMANQVNPPANDWSNIIVWSFNGTTWTQVGSAITETWGHIEWCETPDHKLLLNTEPGFYHSFRLIDVNTGGISWLLQNRPFSISHFYKTADANRWSGNKLPYSCAWSYTGGRATLRLLDLDLI